METKRFPLALAVLAVCTIAATAPTEATPVYAFSSDRDGESDIFVMDESGITSRSADPNNPAVRVVISENGAVDYEGWLFAAMPGIHPYPHERYRVLLIEGIAAE